MKQITRRAFLETAALAGGAVAAGSWLAACGQASGPSKAGGKIVVGSFKDPAMDLVKQKYLPRFTRETGIQTEYLETDYDAWYEKGLNDATSGAGAYDVYVLDDPWVPQFAGSGALKNMTKLGYTPESDFVQSILELGYWPPRSGPVPPTSKGKTPEVFALPIIGDTEILCYRKDIFASAPKTWDDIVANADAKGSVSNKRFGWVFRGAKGNPVVTAWFPILYSFGGQMFDDNWNVTFNNQIGVDALNFQLKLQKYAPAGVAEFDSDQEGAEILKGEAFAANLWTGWDHNVIDPAQSQVVDKLGFSKPPSKVRSASEIGIFIAGISRSAPNAAGALQFMKWFTSTPVQLDFARDGGTPVKVSNFQDSQAVAKTPYLPAVLDTLNVAVARPRTPEWTHVEDALGTQLNQALVDKGSKGAKYYLDAAAQQAKQILQQAGYYS